VEIPLALLFGALLLWWHASVRALDRARELARAFCRRQHWQLLDQTVSLRGLRPMRDTRGLCVARTFGFEFSADRSSRMRGGIRIHGTRAVRIWADGPDGRVIEELG